MKKMLLLLAILGLPGIASAQIAITEIMYDLEGSDTDREWIEIHNTSSENIDVSLWRFGEGEANHKLEAVQGSQILPPGSYAVIVQKLENFKADWPQYGGVIFDSSFSLGNTGEMLVMRDADLKDISTVKYTSDMGGAGDGRSLQLIGGFLAAGMPTPGGTNSASAAPLPLAPSPSPSQSAPSTSPSSSPNAPSSSGTSGTPLVEKSIRAAIETDAVTTVGSRAHFRGRAFGFENKPLENVRYMWNFGDGTTAEGEHVVHTYSFPGTYAAVVSVASGEFSALAQVAIEAVAADVRLLRALRSGAEALVVYNNRAENLDLSGWRLSTGEQFFVIPAHTFVLSRSSATFPQETTHLATVGGFSLLYPNGTVAALGEEEKIETVPQKTMETVSNPREEASVMKSEPAPKKRTVGEKKKKTFGAPAARKEEIISTATTEVLHSVEDLPAAASVPVHGALWKWVVGLAVLIAGGAGAAVILRKRESDTITLVD